MYNQWTLLCLLISVISTRLIKLRLPIKTAAVWEAAVCIFVGKKRKDEPEEDMFERSEDKNENDIDFEQELKEEDIPKDNLVNKFVNWFRIGKDAD